MGYSPGRCKELGTTEVTNILLYTQEKEQHLHFLLRAHEYSGGHMSDLYKMLN